MKRFKKVLPMIFVLALVITTIILATSELASIGTITGLSLIPLLVGLVWWGSKMVVSDIKAALASASDDE